MRLPGWCTVCHRIRPLVTVSSAGMAMMVASRGVATGICTTCEDAEEERRRPKRKDTP